MRAGSAAEQGHSSPLSDLPGRDDMRRDAGERPDFERLYESAWQSMVRLAALIMSDVAAAEDVAQEAFVNVYRRWDRIAARGDATAYLRTAVVNSARSAMRSRKAATRSMAAIAAREGVSEALAPAVDNDDSELSDLLGHLTHRQREVVVLKYWLDMSETDIARTLSISRGTVKSAASRALDALHRRIQEST